MNNLNNEVADGLLSEASEGRSYSQALSTEVTTRWESFYLQKIDPSVNDSLTAEEVAKFIFGKIKVPEGKLVSYDDSHFQRLDLEVHYDTPHNPFMTTTAINIKHGLRVKPV